MDTDFPLQCKVHSDYGDFIIICHYGSLKDKIEKPINFTFIVLLENLFHQSIIYKKELVFVVNFIIYFLFIDKKLRMLFFQYIHSILCLIPLMNCVLDDDIHYDIKWQPELTSVRMNIQC